MPEFLVLLLEMFLKILPSIIDKDDAVRVKAFRRRATFYRMIADSVGDLSVRIAAFELAEACECCSATDKAGCEDIMGKVQDYQSGNVAMLAALAAARGGDA